MLTRISFLIAAPAATVIGFTHPAPAADEQPDTRVIVVAASYAGANAQFVADTVATPIELQINGTEGLVRIESESGNDGEYAARLYFEPRTDLRSAAELVRKRVALAEPLLPDLVRRNKVSVQVGKAEADPDRVAIAVIDRKGHGWAALQKAAGAAVKRLAAENAVTKPQVFPRDEKQAFADIDRAKCKSLGVPLSDVFKAIQAAGPAAKPDGLKKVIVRGKVSLGELATVKEVLAPSAVYRIDLYPAVRITGAPPAGKSVAEAAARCAHLAETEMNRLNPGGFVVESLAAKKR